MRKIILIAMMGFIVHVGFSQEKINLNNQDGIFISYELTKLSATDKKDKYLVVVKAENKNENDLYFNLPLVKQTNGAMGLSPFTTAQFCDVIIRNSTGLFGNGVRLNASPTLLYTNDNQVLYKIEKGQVITSETQFSVKKDDKPIITNSFLKGLKKLESFDLALNEAFLNGPWVSKCGDIAMNLSITKNEKGESFIAQSVNGRLNNWKKITTTLFEKENDKNASLTYNKSNNTFTYTHIDGVICTWTKK